MEQQEDNVTSETKKLSLQDKEMGLHLLLPPKSTVNVLSPKVRLESSHLYPKLAGSNWTCYITGDIIRLGRAPEHRSHDNKTAVDVDFCGNKQISRRHADIKFNVKKKYWELYVYGRIGVKVNHTLIAKKKRPVPLTTMAYLDIGGNGFVFVLPDGKTGERNNPQTETSTATTIPPSSEGNSLENEKDGDLIDLIIGVFESNGSKNYQPTTLQILRGVIQHCKKESLDQDLYAIENVLRALVLDSRFKVAKTSLDMTAEQADKVKWYLDRPSPPTLEASNEEWPEFDYDFGDSNDHPTGETNEDLSVTTGTPSAIMESGSWASSDIAPQNPVYPVTTTLSSPPLANTLPYRSQPQPDESGPTSAINTAWDRLESCQVSGNSEHMAIYGYSRGVSLLDMYSSISAVEEPTTLPSPSLTPPTLYLPDEPDSNYNKRKLSTAGHEDLNLWTRFRTTLFRAQP